MKLLILSLILSASVIASVPLNKIKDELQLKNSKITVLTATINSLEKSIGKNNKSYIKRLEDFKTTQGSLDTLKSDLEGSASKVSSDLVIVQNLFKRYLLERVDRDNESILVKDQIYKLALKKQLVSLKNSQVKSRELMSSVSTLSQKLDDIRKEERLLYDLIVDLETQKKSYAEKYINVVEQKNSLRDKLEKALARKKINRKKHNRVKRSQKKKRTFKRASMGTKITTNLGLPIESYLSVKSTKKGVNFVFDEVKPVLASSGGHVVYSGELASYGKIIMIDHGNQIRSLVLGDLDISVKKGDRVRKGQVVAYTVSDPGIKKNLYYEIRNKDRAQNTFKILKNKNIL